MSFTVVVVSGGFDPVHSGHLAMFRADCALGDKLIVGVNSDDWLIRKKGKFFMNVEERKAILKSIRWIDEVWEFDDSDDSAIQLLEDIRDIYWPYKIVFANGGDRNETNNRELGVEGIEFVYGVGGNHKMNSSSELLRAWVK